jgi:hypothetical protein
MSCSFDFFALFDLYVVYIRSGSHRQWCATSSHNFFLIILHATSWHEQIEPEDNVVIVRYTQVVCCLHAGVTPLR